MARENHTFSQVPTAQIPRSTFNRSHGHKTAFDAGYLVPFYADEALPGDTFKLRTSIFARLATPLLPIMDNLHLDVFFFFVPNRLLWEHWQNFCGEQPNPGDSIDYLVPVVNSGESGFDRQTIWDHFGIPCAVPNLEVSALWPRAYNLIYNEWFRDQNLQDSLDVPKDDGPDTADTYQLRRRTKRHDYFTSCLPWPQKGEAVLVSIGNSAPVLRDPNLPTVTWRWGPAEGQLFIDAAPGSGAEFSPGGRVVKTGQAQELQGDNALSFGSNTGLFADLSQAEAATINDLRNAFQVQKLLERDARGGTRYTEILRAHFGVVSPDARLQRPEYLGGGSIPINVNPVTQTSNSTGTNPLTQKGSLAAYAIAAGKGLGFSKSFVEHGVIIGLAMVRADLTYQQGLNRQWTRRDRYDFYWPAFAHLGEQPVYNKEIYATGDAEQDNAVFGYQERYAEYRYFPSRITSILNSTHPTPLDAWHLAQEFAELPQLNSDFIEENPPLDRIIAINSEPHVLFDSHLAIACTRPMPTYSVPGLIDHF